jgi:hypothetical protein
LLPIDWVKLRWVKLSTSHRLLADLPAMTAFAQDVENTLGGVELRYDERQRLFKRAEHFGIGRFDANLIIAMVQERTERHAAADEAPKKMAAWIPTAAAFLTIQSAILAGAWWLLIR